MTRRCGRYVGDNDGTCPQLTCIREAGHPGLCDNTSDRPDAPDAHATVRRGFYRHWKGGIYFVHGMAVVDGTPIDGASLVIYESVQGCTEDPSTMRARTLYSFTEFVADRDGHRVPRFVRVEAWP